MAELTWHQAIQRVLSKHGGAMHTRDITSEIVEQGLRQSMGATPEATVGAQLFASVKRQAERSPYVTVSKATFALRSSLNRGAIIEPEPDERPGDDPNVDVEEDEAGLIQAFGMYWERDSVHWASTPLLGGRQRIGADVVDFSDQRGVYLLNDGREVIYVGRTVNRGFGPRFFEHTQDRLRSRWNRFSWFGIRKVTPEGKLVEVSYTPSEELIAVTLEALLIEGLEPRQNRRRGDGFTAVEYLQADDPEIERQRVKSLLESVKSKF